MFNKCLFLFFLSFLKSVINNTKEEIFQIISNNKLLVLDHSNEPSVYTTQMLSEMSINGLNPSIEVRTDKIEEKIEIKTQNFISSFKNKSLFNNDYPSFYKLQDILSNKGSFNLSIEYKEEKSFINYQKLKFIENKKEDFDINCLISFPNLSYNLEKHDMNNTLLMIDEFGYIFSTLNGTKGVFVTSYQEGGLKREKIDKYIDGSKEVGNANNNYISLVKNTKYSKESFKQNKSFILLQDDEYKIFIYEIIKNGTNIYLKPFKEINEETFKLKFFDINFFIFIEKEMIFVFTSYSKGIILYNSTSDKVIFHSETFKNKESLYLNYYIKQIFYDNDILYILNKGFGLTAFNISKISENASNELYKVFEWSHPFIEHFDYKYIDEKLKYLNLIINNWNTNGKNIPEIYVELLVNNHQNTYKYIPLSFNKIFVTTNNYTFKHIINLQEISFIYESTNNSLFIIKNTNDEFPVIFKTNLSFFYKQNNDLKINVLIDQDAVANFKPLNECLILVLSNNLEMFILKDLLINFQQISCKFKTPNTYKLNFKGVSNQCDSLSNLNYSTCENHLEITIEAYYLKDIVLKIMCYVIIVSIAPFILLRIYIVRRFYNGVKLYMLYQIIKLRRKFRSGYSDANDSMELETSKQEINFITESSNQINKINERDTEDPNKFN